MFKTGEVVVIELPKGAWVFEKVLRVGETGMVVSNGRQFPVEGGEDIGNTYPHQILHTSEDEHDRGLVIETMIRQRVLGIIAEASLERNGGYIAEWQIVEQIGLVLDASEKTDCLVQYAVRKLKDDGVIEDVPDLGLRYRLASPKNTRKLIMNIHGDHAPADVISWLEVQGHEQYAAFLKAEDESGPHVNIEADYVRVSATITVRD